MMSIKITKEGAITIKKLIVLIIATMISAQILPQVVLLLVYPALMLGLIFLLPIFHKYRKTPDFSFFGIFHLMDEKHIEKLLKKF